MPRKQRGVNVRVMLNPARRSGESENEEARASCVAAGIEVRDSNPKFDLTHQKSMVIDDQTGFVESLNWEPRDLTETRDYAVVTTHEPEIARDGCSASTPTGRTRTSHRIPSRG